MKNDYEELKTLLKLDAI